MVNANSYIESVIKRNLSELKDAIIMSKVLDKLGNTKTLHPLNFFRVVAIALYRDIITHLCLVFEINSVGKSFWYIEKKLTNKIEKIAEENSISIDNLKKISKKLKPIRNKTHFHIGSEYPDKPKHIFEEYHFKNQEVIELLESGFKILKTLYKDMYNVEYQLPDYDGSDVKNILESYIEAYPENGIVTYI